MRRADQRTGCFGTILAQFSTVALVASSGSAVRQSFARPCGAAWASPRALRAGGRLRLTRHWRGGRCGLSHQLEDEDVVQIVKKKARPACAAAHSARRACGRRRARTAGAQWGLVTSTRRRGAPACLCPLRVPARACAWARDAPRVLNSLHRAAVASKKRRVCAPVVLEAAGG